jgi:hypothetical protein
MNIHEGSMDRRWALALKGVVDAIVVHRASRG